MSMGRPPSLAAGLAAAGALALIAGSAVFAQDGATDPAVPRPGLYRVSATILELNASGMPTDLNLEAMNASFAGDEMTSCITTQDTEVSASTLIGQVSGQTCKFRTFAIAGGRMDTELLCKGPDGKATTIRTYGSIGSEGMDVIAEFSGHGMSSKMKLVSERVGDCPAESAPAED